MYKEVTGMTYAEYQTLLKERHDAYIKDAAEHEKKIPELKKFRENEGKKFVTKNIDQWTECVIIRLRDLYQGMELTCLQELAPFINDEQFEEAKKKLNAQGHSGMSYGLMKSLIVTFFENGERFIDFLKTHG